MINLSSVLAIMKEKDKNGEPLSFKIKFITCNPDKNIGGEIIELDNCIMTGLPYESKQRIGIKSLINNHHPYPVHQRLIMEFNGQKVFY